MKFDIFFSQVDEIGFMRLILETCISEGALRNQAAYLLASADHETMGTFEPVIEAYWLSDAWRKKNLRYYPWHGRGFVQLTWEDNYKKAANELGIPFDKNPSLAEDPKNAALVLVRGTLSGWWTGLKLGQFVNLQKSDFVGARKCINGTDRAASIAKIARKYDAALKAAGYGETSTKAPKPKDRPIPPSGGRLSALIVLIVSILKSIFGKGK